MYGDQREDVYAAQKAEERRINLNNDPTMPPPMRVTSPKYLVDMDGYPDVKNVLEGLPGDFLLHVMDNPGTSDQAKQTIKSILYKRLEK